MFLQYRGTFQNLNIQAESDKKLVLQGNSVQHIDLKTQGWMENSKNRHLLQKKLETCQPGIAFSAMLVENYFKFGIN